MSARLKWLQDQLRKARERAGLSDAQLEERLALGPGWVSAIENGNIVPSMEVLFAILDATGVSPAEFFTPLKNIDPRPVAERQIFAEQAEGNIVIKFKYARFDAKYLLPNSEVTQFDSVIKVLRNGLARLVALDAGGDGEEDEAKKAIKTEAVADAFLYATKLWPHISPSDIWWFIVSRLYCDPLNHPAAYARLNHEQSWKRASGWALEEVLVRHYGPYLRSKGIEIAILPAEEKRDLAASLNLGNRVEADKIDVVLHGISKGVRKFFGVVHVKASFAERRTDDVPLSQSLIAKGFLSPLWTMDCKGTPAEWPKNRGELGRPLEANSDPRSAKRKDIEDEGYFSGCFSYNTATLATPEAQKAKYRVFVCDFNDPENDKFSQYVVDAWERFRKCGSCV